MKNNVEKFYSGRGVGSYSGRYSSRGSSGGYSRGGSNYRSNRVQQAQTSTITTLGGRGGAAFWGWGYPYAYINCNDWSTDCYLEDQYVPKILYPYGVLPELPNK
jgi:hypothetical protein